MRNIINYFADSLVSFTEWMNKVNEDYAAFLQRGMNRFVVAAIFGGSIFLFTSYSLYRDVRKIWIALIPIVILFLAMFYYLVKHAYRNKLNKKSRSSRMRRVGFNTDFNERILRRIYGSLAGYELHDERLTSFQDFYNVLALDFNEHDSVLYFNCTQPQLKYILDKFKQLKKGISLKSFERSKKVFHKGNPICAETLSKKYNEFPPDVEFEKQIDSFFKFLGDI